MMEPNYLIGKRVSPGVFKPPLLIYHQLIAVILELQPFAENYKIDVLEMICLWEALFPDDQNSFQQNHIMDLVSSIPFHGSMLYGSSPHRLNS